MTYQSAVSICDRLKGRYGNYQQDWQSLFQGRNARDIEFIRYIVNFIIEQAKHNIVISKLPDVIRTLHCEAESIIRKNRIITLEEAISRVQTAGAMKYPYLKKVKPISTDDFVKEVMREVFNRLGTVITLDKIENICQFITCSAKQLLHAMSVIDVDEAATLIIEDISRHQSEIDRNQKLSDVDNTAELKTTGKEKTMMSTKIMNRQAYRKPEDTPLSISKERMRTGRESSRSTQNSNESQSTTTLVKQPEFRDLPTKKKKSQSPKNSSTPQRSFKLDNKKQQGQSSNQTHFKLNNSTFNADSHFAQTLLTNPFATARRRKSIKDAKSIYVSSSAAIPLDTCPTEECRLLEIEQKAISVRQPNMINEKTERSTRKPIVKNPIEEIINSLTSDVFPISKNNLLNQKLFTTATENNTFSDQKVKLSKSNTQTYSIHSEEGLSIQARKPKTTTISDTNDNAIINTSLKSTKLLNEISRKPAKQTFTNFIPFSNPEFYSKDRPFIIEAMNNSDSKYSIRHYNKSCYQYSDISDNEDQTTDNDTENCPLEDILDHRFKHQLDITQ